MTWARHHFGRGPDEAARALGWAVDCGLEIPELRGELDSHFCAVLARTGGGGLHKLHTRELVCARSEGEDGPLARARVAHRVVDEAHDQQREHDDAEVRVCGGGALGEVGLLRRARERRETHRPTTPTSSVGCCSSSARFTGPSGEQSGASAIFFCFVV